MYWDHVETWGLSVLLAIAERIQPGSYCQAKWSEKLALLQQESARNTYQPLVPKASPPTGPLAPALNTPPTAHGLSSRSVPSSRAASAPSSSSRPSRPRVPPTAIPVSSGDECPCIASPPNPSRLGLPEGPRSRSIPRALKDESLLTPPHRRRSSDRSGLPQSGSTDGFQTPLKSTTSSPQALKKSILSGILFSASSAMLGSQSLITGKSMAVFIRHSSQGTVEFLHPFNLFNVMFFLSVTVGWAVAAAFWLYRLSMSLLMYDAMFIIPLNQTMWIIFSVASGGVFYQEFRALEFQQWAMLFCGLLLVIGGVIFLVPNDHKKEFGQLREEIQLNAPPSTSSDIEEQQTLLSRSPALLQSAES